MIMRRAKSKEQRVQNSPPTHPSPSRGEGKGGGGSLCCGLSMLRSEKGIALVMVLILALIALAIVSSLIFLVTQGTKTSGYHKRYATSLDAGHGGAEIVADLVTLRGDLSIPLPSFGLPTHPIPGSCACGFDADPYDENYPLPSPDTCLCRKLCIPAYKSDGTNNWEAAGAGACSAGGASASMDPIISPDMLFTLAGTGTSYDVFAKIVDTTIGVTDLSGEQLDCGTGVGYMCGTFEGPPTPYLYRIEVNSQNTANVIERSRLSVLYAF